MFIRIIFERTQDVNLLQPHECSKFLTYSTERKICLSFSCLMMNLYNLPLKILYKRLFTYHNFNK